MKRTLRLQREALTELSADDLAGVAGAGDFTRVGFTCPLRQCGAQYTVPPDCGISAQDTCGC